MTPSEWFELVKTIFSAVGAVGAAIAATYGIKSRLAPRHAAAAAIAAAAAEEQSADASANSASANDSVVEVKNSVKQVQEQVAEVVDSVHDFGDRFNGVYAALIAERLQEQRLKGIEEDQKRILEFMADLEQERHITGNLAEFQRSTRSSHE